MSAIDLPQVVSDVERTVGKAKPNDLIFGSELHDQVLAIYYQVCQADNQALVPRCEKLRIKFKFKKIEPIQLDRVKEPDLIRTTFGTVNQFQDGENSSCTCCAQSFLRNILPLGIAWDITPEQVTNFVQEGKALYFPMLKQIKHQAEKNAEPLGAKFRFNQALSVHEAAGTYGIKINGSLSQRVLQPDKKGSLVPFFRDQLTQLETLLLNDKSSVGATIHCQEYTYALAIFDTNFGREYVFFDSHGASTLNNGNANAYIKLTFDPAAMAQFLATRMKYNYVEREIAADLAELQKTKMEAKINPYILYIVEVNERGILGVMSDPSSASSSAPSSSASTSTASTSPSPSSPTSSSRAPTSTTSTTSASSSVSTSPPPSSPAPPSSASTLPSSTDEQATRIYHLIIFLVVSGFLIIFSTRPDLFGKITGYTDARGQIRGA